MNLLTGEIENVSTAACRHDVQRFTAGVDDAVID
jgi:hypothetical protein